MIFKKALFIALILSSGFLTAQNIKEAADKDPAAEAGKDGEDDRFNLSEFDPVNRTDWRFRIRNLNFVRRYASHGNGEFLDVHFEVLNSTDDPIDFYGYVTAFWETNAVHEKNREWLPYPQWREEDPEKEDFLVHYITTTPSDIPDEEIWSQKEKAYLAQDVVLNRMRNAVSATDPIPPFKPPFWRYLSYIMKNPEKGLPFQVFGKVGPTTDKAQESNYIPPTPDEMRKKMHTTLEKHKYTIQHSRQRVLFASHHYSEFRENYKFFNRVSIVLFDKAKIEKNKALPQGESAENPLAFKASYKLNDKMKSY